MKRSGGMTMPGCFGAPPLQLQAGFPIHKSELLARLEPEPQAWAPQVQRSDDSAEDQPAKQQLTRSPEPGTWWNSYRSPVSVPSSDSSSSDNESSSEKEEERNVKTEGLRITKPRAALLGKCELQQEGCESWQTGQPQDNMRMPFCWTSEKGRGFLKSRKRKSGMDPEKNLFVCPHCGNGFNRKSSLKRHVETIHDGTKLFEWPPRRKNVLEKSNSETHVRKRLKTSHSGKEPYECPECGESFQTSASFTKHRRTHTNEIRFQCPACDRSYIKQRYLVKHLITAHSGAYLSKCPDCGKSFLGEGDLSMHQTKIHGGGGFHQCLDCGKCYQEKLSLISHQALHTKQDPFKCPECEKTFVCSRSLANHWRIHQKEKLHKSLNQEGSDTEESLYKCPDCGKCFKAERCFVNHQRNHMKEQQSLQPDQGEVLKVEVQDPEIHTEMQCHTESACRKSLGARLSQPEAEVEEMLHSSGKGQVDGSALAVEQASDIDENSNNWSGSSTLSGHHVEETPVECAKSADGSPLARCQSVHVEENPSKALDCEGTFRDHSVSLQGQTCHAAMNASNGTHTSAGAEHQGVHMKEPTAEFSNRVDSDISTKDQSTHLKENSIKGFDDGDIVRDHLMVTRFQGSHAEEDVLKGTYNFVYPRQEGACMEDSVPDSSEKREVFTASLTLKKLQNIHRGITYRYFRYQILKKTCSLDHRAFSLPFKICGIKMSCFHLRLNDLCIHCVTCETHNCWA
uniref:Uncharacterized protein n=1 Tax=Sphaerodactylus townsendi TaxID=933632 RepID=A0ACB8EGF6_9SAUR